jgi:energy-coupling factor transporter transmembrane protein EcfT
MQYFVLAMSSLIVTTRSPKNCEDGWFTGYLLTLPLFSAVLILYLFGSCILLSLKIKNEYYAFFFQKVLFLTIALIFANFLGNLVSKNDCGFYSVRGFTACSITVCSFISLILAKLVGWSEPAFEWLNNTLERKF